MARESDLTKHADKRGKGQNQQKGHEINSNKRLQAY